MLGHVGRLRLLQTHAAARCKHYARWGWSCEGERLEKGRDFEGGIEALLGREAEREKGKRRGVTVEGNEA